MCYCNGVVQEKTAVYYLFKIRLLNIDDPIKRNTMDSLARIMWYIRNFQHNGLELTDSEQHSIGTMVLTDSDMKFVMTTFSGSNTAIIL